MRHQPHDHVVVVEIRALSGGEIFEAERVLTEDADIFVPPEFPVPGTNISPDWVMSTGA